MLKLDKLNSFNDSQFWNIPFIFIEFDISKLLIYNSVRFLQVLNKLEKSVICEVSKLLISNDVKLSQWENIPEIWVTLLVLKLDKFNDNKLLHP